jgi:hypothetical protein
MVQPLQPTPTKRRTHPLLWVVLGLAVLLLGAICAGTVASLADKGKPKTAFNDPVAEASTKQSQTESNPGSKMSVTKPAGPQTSFGDGTWEVGADIVAGTYMAQVPNTSLICYWERESGLSGTAGDVIANGTVAAKGQAKVTVAAGDKGFKSQGCGTWHKVG